MILGSITPLDLAFDQPLWLSLAVDGEAPLAPRIALTAGPYSLTAKAVHGETNTFPSDGDVGIGTGRDAGKNGEVAGIAVAPQAKLDVEGDLRIGVVPPATDPTKVLVQEDIDGIVRYVPIDSLPGGGGGGFGLPFSGTLSAAAPGIDVTNNGGPGLRGVGVTTGVAGEGTTGVHGSSATASGTDVEGQGDTGVKGQGTTGVKGVGGNVGVVGEGPIGVEGSANVTAGIGVEGTTTSGTGVRGMAHGGGTGVHGESVTGPGVQGIGDPAGQFHGTLEIRTLGRQSKLFIEEMEADPNEQKVLVWSADQFVRYRTLSTLGFDGTLNDAALIITDAGGNETTRINPDGTSFHEGLETFRGGIKLEGAGVGLTFADGTTQETGFSLPCPSVKQSTRRSRPSR